MEKTKLLKVFTALAKLTAKGAKEHWLGYYDINGNPQLTSYDHVYLDGKIIRAHDGGSTWLTAELTCETEEPFVVNLQSLKQAVTAFKNGEITLRHDGENLRINEVVKVKSYDVQQGFRHPIATEPQGQQLLPTDFYTAYKLVQVNVSKDPIRPNMCEVLLEDNKLVATDAHVLMTHDIDYPHEEGFIIPTLPCDLGGQLTIERTTPKKTKDDKYGYCEMIGNDFTFSFKEYEGRYPMYQNVCPDVTLLGEVVTMQADDLLDEIAKAKLIKPFGAFEFTDTGVIVSAENCDYLTEYKGSAPCTLDGFGIRIRFYYDKLEKALKPYKGKIITIHMNEPERAATILCEQLPKIYVLIMPCTAGTY